MDTRNVYYWYNYKYIYDILKGFIIGFSLSSFFLVYKYKGLLAALIYVFPTSIINILVCLLLGVYSVLFTINLWKIIFLKEKDFNMKRL